MVFERNLTGGPDRAEPTPRSEWSLKKTLADKKRSEIFAKFLMRADVGRDDLADALIKGDSADLTPKRLMELGGLVNQFNEELQRVEEVREKITPELIEAACAYSQELTALKENVLGGEGIGKIVVEQLEHLAISEPQVFARIISAVEEYQQVQSEITAREQEVKQMMAKYGRLVTEDELTPILQEQDAGEREERLRDLMLRKYKRVSLFGQWGVDHLMGRGNLAHVEEKVQALNVREEVLRRQEELRSALGAIATGVTGIAGNEEFRSALAAEVRSEEHPVEQEDAGAGFEAARKAAIDPEYLDTDEFKKEWRQYKRVQIIQRQYRGRTPQGYNDTRLDADWGNLRDKDVIRDAFAKKFWQRRSGGKKGLWLNILKPMLEQMVMPKLD